MRSFWLASAATIFIAGAACAQTMGPAPTGAPNAATTTAPGQSPGNLGTNTSGGSTEMAPGAPAKDASGSATPPTVTSPGASAGKTMSAGPSAGSSMSSMGSTTAPASKPMMSSSTTMTHHHYMHSGMGTGMMPASASTSTYLTIAKHSVMHHNKAMADEALSRAETNMLDRSVPQGGIAADSDPGVTSVESARKAVMTGDMKGAISDINMAMQQSGDMSGGMSSSNGMGSGAMATPAASKPAMPMKPAHSMFGSSNSGLAPNPGDTSDSGAVGGAAAVAPSKSAPASTP